MICSCCKNEYHDTFLSCPFCGTASSVTSARETKPCAKCGAPVLPGQPMCQQCGLVDPIRSNEPKTQNVSMPNVGEEIQTGPTPSARIEPQSPYAQNIPYPQNQPYQQSQPYQQNTYGQNPYQQPPYGQNPYGQNPYGQNPYGQVPPYMQNPYQPYGNPADPMYQQEVKSIKSMATAAMIFAFFIPLVTYILFGIANSRSKRMNYNGSKTLLTAALVIAIVIHVLAFLLNMSQYT